MLFAMTDRTPVLKTCKLFIGGGYPRSESGRTTKVCGPDGTVIAHASRASRKDLRDAVEKAAAAQAGWAGRDAYNRGQILHRLAEMLEGRRGELAEAIRATSGRGEASALREVDASIDRVVAFAGWTDKLAAVLGGRNDVAGPYHNFTVPGPVGVTGLLVPEPAPGRAGASADGGVPPLLALVTMLGPVLAGGSTAVAVGGEHHPLSWVVFAEACGVADVPAGVINLLTGSATELLEPMASHRELRAIGAANLDRDALATLETLAADQMARVRHESFDESAWYDHDRCESPWRCEAFLEMKTIWHPSAC